MFIDNVTVVDVILPVLSKHILLLIFNNATV